ncbi:hypothetical protein B0H14DRAFT_2631945 [Mycena olivaceomarginata]|nr:hypothetical protein B0H14DRAFT_2631945 [Mycena olivaceomarginata]
MRQRQKSFSGHLTVTAAICSGNGKAALSPCPLFTAVVVGNSPQDAQGPEQASESPVWTYDPTDATLTLTWYNTDGCVLYPPLAAGTTIPVKVGSILYATGNVEQLAGRFNRPDVRIIKYRLQTTIVQNH